MISIVIPNYNGGELLKNNLPKLLELLKKSKLDYEIIISDDASTDNSIQILQGFPITLITNSENSGFGSNVDRGIRKAQGEIIFILNAIDILPEKPAYFSIMLNHFANLKVFSVAAVKKDSESHGRGVIIFYRGLFLHFRSHEDYKNWLSTMRTAKLSVGKEVVTLENGQTAWADGGAQALRREYYLKIGGFDPKYKFYWEDVDLGYRAWQAGYVIDYEPKAVLIHKKEKGPIAKRFNDKERRIMNIRNQFIFTWKNSDLSQKLLFILWQPYYLAVAFKNRDLDWFKAYWQAVVR